MRKPVVKRRSLIVSAGDGDVEALAFVSSDVGPVILPPIYAALIRCNRIAIRIVEISPRVQRGTSRKQGHGLSRPAEVSQR